MTLKISSLESLIFKTLINFWFNDIEEKRWWVKDRGFDAQIRDRFGGLHHSANACELYEWRKSPVGRLAEIIVLDQSLVIYSETHLKPSHQMLWHWFQHKQLLRPVMICFLMKHSGVFYICLSCIVNRLKSMMLPQDCLKRTAQNQTLTLKSSIETLQLNLVDIRIAIVFWRGAQQRKSWRF